MDILGVIVALALIVVAYIVGEKNGDATGYERGTFDGRQKARNEAEAALSANEAARRQRETMERARQHENTATTAGASATGPQVIDDIAAVPTVEPAATPAPAPAQSRRNDKRRPKSRHR